MLEFVEENSGIVWLRCARCYVLFKLTKKEFEENYSEVPRE